MILKYVFQEGSFSACLQILEQILFLLHLCKSGIMKWQVVALFQVCALLANSGIFVYFKSDLKVVVLWDIHVSCIPRPVLKAVILHAINSIVKNLSGKSFSLGQQIASSGNPERSYTSAQIYLVLFLSWLYSRWNPVMAGGKPGAERRCYYGCEGICADPHLLPDCRTSWSWG